MKKTLRNKSIKGGAGIAARASRVASRVCTGATCVRTKIGQIIKEKLTESGIKAIPEIDRKKKNNY